MGVRGQTGQELADLSLTHLCRMSLSVEKDVPLDPTNIGVLRVLAEVPSADGLAHAVEELGFLRATDPVHLAHSGPPFGRHRTRR